MCSVGDYAYVNATETTTSKVTGKTQIECDLQVTGVQPNVVDLFLDLDFSANITVKDWIVYGKIDSANLKNVTHTHAAPNITVDDADIKAALFTITDILVTIIDNGFLSKGIPLPSVKDVDLTNSLLQVKNEYFAIGATPIWNITAPDNRSNLKLG